MIEILLFILKSALLIAGIVFLLGVIIALLKSLWGVMK